MVSYFFPVKILNLRKGEGNKLRLPKFMIRMDLLSLRRKRNLGYLCYHASCPYKTHGHGELGQDENHM